MLTQPVHRADAELGRFIREQLTCLEAKGHPPTAKRVSLAPVLSVTDDAMAAVASFYASLPSLRRRIAADWYCRGSAHSKARRASMSVRRMQREMDRLLASLAGVQEVRS